MPLFAPGCAKDLGLLCAAIGGGMGTAVGWVRGARRGFPSPQVHGMIPCGLQTAPALPAHLCRALTSLPEHLWACC